MEQAIDSGQDRGVWLRVILRNLGLGPGRRAMGQKLIRVPGCRVIGLRLG